MRKPTLVKAPRRMRRLWPMAKSVWDLYDLSPAARKVAAKACRQYPARALTCYAAILASLRAEK